MSVDIVEIALDRFTDGFLFEKIAAEVMRDEGFHDIKRLGGATDFGMDAESDVIYEHSGKSRTIFQFTLEDYVLGKMRDTVEKLNLNKIEFSELIIVTTSDLSTERQENVRKTARKEFDVTATCYARNTIVNRLADMSNGIFTRNFPSIDKQLEGLQKSQPIFDDSGNSREIALLRTSISVSLSTAATPTRKALFDRLVLSTLAEAYPNYLSTQQVADKLTKTIGADAFQVPQINASIKRLREQIDVSEDKYAIKANVACVQESNTIKVNNITKSFISDVVERVREAETDKLTTDDINRLIRNARNVLRELFRMYGMELAALSQPDSVAPNFDADAHTGLIDLASRQVSPQRGALLLSALADAIRCPSEKHVHVLAAWGRIHVGVSLMNIDPVLRECQASRLRVKEFILDTDTVLNAVFSELPTAHANQVLIKTLVNLGCRVIIPEAVIDECANHAIRSHKTHTYFREKLLGMTEALVISQVRNVFVRAYWYSIRDGRIPKIWQFKEFLDNYIDVNNPIEFLRDVVMTTLPEGVQIVSIDDEFAGELIAEDVGDVSQKLLEIMKRRAHLDTRAEEENEKLATTDARLMLSTIGRNSANLTDSSKHILWAKCYVVTNSRRYLRAASELGLKNMVCSTPLQLLGILEQITGATVSETELLHLYENPIIIGAVEGIWDELEGLLSNGISLQGKSLVRLRRDMDACLHECLILSNRADEKGPEQLDSEGDVEKDEYVQLLDAAESLGYGIHPVAQKAREAFSVADDSKSRIHELEGQVTELKATVEQFGKKKARYLRRMENRKNLQEKKKQ